jgi:hypothetical protein
MAMHASTERLYRAAAALRNVTGQSNVARLLNESPQTVKNWESRGVSDAGAIKSEGVIGCSAYWLATGEGLMHPAVSNHRQIPPAAPPLSAALPVVLGALAGVTDAHREELAQVLALLAKTGSPLYQQRLAELLAAPAQAPDQVSLPPKAV